MFLLQKDIYPSPGKTNIIFLSLYPASRQADLGEMPTRSTEWVKGTALPKVFPLNTVETGCG
ncbi:hypothetical protein [Mucilaginibacter gotjawali]|uniref:Uncharacterized protein n=2 Tax=Mucilaginibacter gotjawali TaxID=1550579 RepID=A0A120MY21_9SPHI|nr:hypothetical protein [Mucilaginibacter gotjawali]MBB3057840.1 hypothetical protein [Mucilaginibacter gotjawali]BAU52388.1 hypothetical protein MgSA37_00544 [Mucilaginibacter gotjawali]